MKRFLVIASVSVFLFDILFCSEMSVSGNGGSSETINAKVIISDTVVTLRGDQGVDTGLFLDAFSVDYRPYEKTGFTVRFDNEGKNSKLTLPVAGTYNFLIRCKDNNLVGYISNIPVTPGRNDSVSCILARGGGVDGRLIAQDRDLPYDNYVVSIYGSPFMCITDNTKKFSLNVVPGGRYTINIRPTGKYLFIATARYNFSTNDNGERTLLDVMVPR